MKNTIFTIIFLIAGFSGFSQLEEEDIMVDVNYGLLGGNKGLIFTFVEELDSANQVNTSYFGPIALRFQYMLSESVGVGLETNYNSRSATWNENSYDGELNQYINQDYKLTQTIIRFMFRTSYEFVNEEKYQMMWSNSIGYRMALWKIDPNYNIGTLTGGWPLAFRTALGMRYWFSENVGLNAELGLSGGSYANAGLSAKF